MKFLFFSEYGETLDLAAYMKNVCQKKVLLFVKDKEFRRLGDGIVPKIEDWWNYLGRGYTWVFDTTSFGSLQDYLRSKGEPVVGGCEKGDALENDRHLGQKWFKECGFDQVKSHNFTDISEAVDFVEANADRRWVLKQNGDAPKSISYLGKFEDCSDLIYHLSELKRSWNEVEYGKFDCDLMEVVEGTEVGATAFFNGDKFLENHSGKVVGFLDFEDKKEVDGGLGETTGEMGTTFVGVDETSPLFKKIIVRPVIIQKLRDIGYRGVFNINCILTDDNRLVALEPTMRFGMPATSYELMDGLTVDSATVLDAMARGIDQPIEVFRGIGMVMCVVAKPYPLEVDVEPNGTSVGAKLWILDKEGNPSDDFSEAQRTHIHLYNFVRDTRSGDERPSYRVATKNGFLLSVTHKGLQLKAVRKQLIEYIKSNLFLTGMKYRSDIGKRVEDFIETV